MNERMSIIGGSDILTSLRWLVADGRLMEEERRAVGSDAAVVSTTAAARAEPVPVARLLLTPALRVDGQGDAAPTSRPQLAEAPATETIFRIVPPEVDVDGGGIPSFRRAAERSPLLLTPQNMISEEVPVMAEAVAPPSADQMDQLSQRLAELETLLSQKAQENYDLDAGELEDISAWLAQNSGDQAPFIALNPPNPFETPEPVTAVAVPAPIAAEPAPEPALQADEAPDLGLDSREEELLREMIRSVLREELEGATGERVTRNLRKIIRSEITRAFLARGLT